MVNTLLLFVSVTVRDRVCNFMACVYVFQVIIEYLGTYFLTTCLLRMIHLMMISDDETFMSSHIRTATKYFGVLLDKIPL